MLKYIKNVAQLNKAIAEYIDYPNKNKAPGDDLVCITGAKLPDWLKTWKPIGRKKIYRPESKLSPLEQADYIQDLYKSGTGFKYVIITYSPWIISDIKDDNILVFGNGRKVESPGFTTFGSSVNRITMGLLGRCITTGVYSHNKLNSYSKRLDNNAGGKEEFDALIQEISNTFGDSIEKSIFLHNLWDKEEKKQLKWQKE